MGHHDDRHDRGLDYDLATLWERRRLLGLFGALGAASLVGCDDERTPSAAQTKSSTDASCEAIPEETGGPFPGDGSNGPNVLTESGIVRRDIRPSFGSATGRAEGVPLTIKMSLQGASTCAPLAGVAVYLWHCDRDGRYSLYSEEVSDQNYLRGVQRAASDGSVTFTSIFPAAYAGRWPHIHFEVYTSLAEATKAGQILSTSQIALPEDTCNEVYATTGYEQSVQNLSQTSLSSDMVFGEDRGVRQVASVTGSVHQGLTASLVVPV